METKSKAQLKKEQDDFNYVNTNLRNKLKSFENKYLNACVKFAFDVVKAQIKNCKKEIETTKTGIQVFRGKEIPLTSYQIESRVKNYQDQIKRLETQLDLDALITFNAITEAKSSYDQKVDRVVKTLIEEGFGCVGFKVEQIKSERSTDFSFLISKADKEVHARLIWVDAVEKTPHFRFITTTRKIS